jgi:hypothetical protein
VLSLVRGERSGANTSRELWLKMGLIPTSDNWLVPSTRRIVEIELESGEMAMLYKPTAGDMAFSMQHQSNYQMAALLSRCMTIDNRSLDLQDILRMDALEATAISTILNDHMK